MGVMRGCHLAKAEPIRGLSSKSGKFRQSGNYFWIKNIKGFGFPFFPHLELTCLLRIHCGAHGCESNAIHKFFYPVTISVASHFTFSRWLSSPPRYHFLSVQDNEPAHRPIRWVQFVGRLAAFFDRPLFTLWIQSAQARMPVFEFLDS